MYIDGLASGILRVHLMAGGHNTHHKITSSKESLKKNKIKMAGLRIALLFLFHFGCGAIPTMPLKRSIGLGMVMTWIKLHRAFYLKSSLRSPFSIKCYASSLSPDENKDSSSISASNKQSRLSKYYDEIFKGVDEKKKSPVKQYKSLPIIPNLESDHVDDLNSLKSDTEDEALSWNPDKSWPDDSIHSITSSTQEYRSLTRDLASSAHRKIPPATLSYDYSCNQEESISSRQRSLQIQNGSNNNDESREYSFLQMDAVDDTKSIQIDDTKESMISSRTKSHGSDSVTKNNNEEIKRKNIPTDNLVNNEPLGAPVQNDRIGTLQPRNANNDSSSTEETNNQDPVSYINLLKGRLARLEFDMYSLNQNNTFNVNSRQQVSKVLFGVENESINKDSLEALAGSNRIPANRIAGLLLSHRKTSRQLKTLQKDAEVIRLAVNAGRLSPDTFDIIKPESSEDHLDIRSPSPASQSIDQNLDPLMLVDASAYIFRAYYSMPPIHRGDGMPVGAVLGFCNMINNLVLDAYVNGERPRLVLVFDSKDGANIRKSLYPQYKGNRPPCPVDLVPQFDLIKEAADAYGIIKIEAPGHEADDVIATLATMAQKDGCKVKIYSADKDLMQLITKDACITMVDPMKLSTISYNVVVDKWNVTPEKLGDVLALAGDSSDNIPGVPGIGPKTAASLINQFGSLDDLLLNLGSIKPRLREKLELHQDSLSISRQLVKLETAIPTENMTVPDYFTSVTDLRMEPRTLENEDRLFQFYSDMGLKDIARRVKTRFYQERRNPTFVPTRSAGDDTVSTVVSSRTEGIPSKQCDEGKVLDNNLLSSISNPSDKRNVLNNNLLDNISFVSPRAKKPPGPMEYDDIPF